MPTEASLKPAPGSSRPRPASLSSRLARVQIALQRLHPAKLVILGYSLYITLGWALLCLPSAQRANDVPALDNLFTAASAVSTTGLVTVSVSDRYSFFGQLVVLGLIQLGGIGYMTLGSFLLLARGRELPAVRQGVGHAVFSLPDSFHLATFLRGVIWFTLGIELVGAIALYFVFADAGLPQPIWSAVFHSVSSFCTAGFSLYNDSFAPMAGNFYLNAVVATLSYLGAIGFIVCLDAAQLFAGKVRQVTLTTKIILAATFWISVAGTLLLFLAEPSIQKLSPDARLLAAFFQSMTAMTTVGFNTVDIGQLSKASVLLITVLMIVGSSPSGTGGGVKVTTITAMLGVMRSAARGDTEVRFWNRAIPTQRVALAFAALGFYLLAFVIGAYLLELTETTPFEKNLFEVASALGTVGLSMGITAGLSTLGKILVTIMMFCGRVGPLVLGSAILGRVLAEAPTRDNDLAV